MILNKHILPKKFDQLLTLALGLISLGVGIYAATIYFVGIDASADGSVVSMDPSPGLGIFQLSICFVIFMVLAALYKTQWQKSWLNGLAVGVFAILLMFETLMNGGWRGF